MEGEHVFVQIVKNNMKIAVTGQIGSGKSYLLNQIKNIYHYEVYSSDDFVREAYDDDNIKIKLNEAFNCLIDNKIDKNVLKKNLNNNYELLNSIIHPYVKNKIINLDDNNKIIFVEVPLLFESSMDNLFDATIAIDIDDASRHEYLYNRNKINYDYYLMLESLQFDTKTKTKFATYIYHKTKDDTSNLNNLDEIINKIKNNF